MNIDIPYNIGDHIYVNGKKKTIRGIHIYITNDEMIKKYRFYLGVSFSRLITLTRKRDDKYEQICKKRRNG